jgi:hypothetical protein
MLKVKNCTEPNFRLWPPREDVFPSTLAEGIQRIEACKSKSNSIFFS